MSEFTILVLGSAFLFLFLVVSFLDTIGAIIRNIGGDGD